MAAPEYVPHPKADRPRVYESPPWRPEPWLADRPAELAGGQPSGLRLGAPGPDQGFVLRLARQFEGRLHLAEGEHEADAIAGCAAVALKRASLFGRAPVVHDLTVAFAVWGFLAPAPADLVAQRRRLFPEVSNPHHYMELRRIPDLVPMSVLRMTPEQVRQQAATDWKAFFNRKPAAAGAESGAPAVAAKAVPVRRAVARNTQDVADLAARAKEALRNAPRAEPPRAE